MRYLVIGFKVPIFDSLKAAVMGCKLKEYPTK